ncbi:hypothetical protein EZV62_026114 [Acer yangbiense]|uniref:Uncharacterized protein n=1 Tax=Acer yangbiense TaxID=1000413 RepID=A0A5C7GQM8_9ROSI|nr:hypothetical protein EZV62_026114 [Acer yangbiense]
MRYEPEAFEIRGKISTSLLSPMTTYVAYLVFFLYGDIDDEHVTSYIEYSPIEVFVGLAESNNGQRRTVYFQREHQDGDDNGLFLKKWAGLLENEFSERYGWLESELGEFFNQGDLEGELLLIVETTNKDGLIEGHRVKHLAEDLSRFACIAHGESVVSPSEISWVVLLSQHHGQSYIFTAQSRVKNKPGMWESMKDQYDEEGLKSLNISRCTATRPGGGAIGVSCLQLWVSNPNQADLLPAAAASAADSDFVWNRFLSPEYLSKISDPGSVSSLPKKELYLRTCRNLVQNGKLCFWIDLPSGTKHYMISPKELYIQDVEDIKFDNVVEVLVSTHTHLKKSLLDLLRVIMAKEEPFIFIGSIKIKMITASSRKSGQGLRFS